MTINDYFILPTDFKLRHIIGLVVSVFGFYLLDFAFTVDVAFLVGGVLFMVVGGVSYRVPLMVAILSLLVQMALAFIVEQGNQWERLSENIAVLTFFMMVFGLVKMVWDEAVESIRARRGHVVDDNQATDQEPSAPGRERVAIPRGMLQSMAAPDETNSEVAPVPISEKFERVEKTVAIDKPSDAPRPQAEAAPQVALPHLRPRPIPMPVTEHPFTIKRKPVAKANHIDLRPKKQHPTNPTQRNKATKPSHIGGKGGLIQ